jgi:hypothetical protein
MLRFRSAFLLGAVLLGCGALSAQEKEKPAPAKVMRVPDGGKDPQVAVAADGTVHLVFWKGDDKGGDLFHASRAADAAEFGKAVRVNADAGTVPSTDGARGAQIAVSTKFVHVVWNGGTKAKVRAPGPTGAPAAKTAPVLYARADRSGGAFDAEKTVSTASWGIDGGSAVTADADGAVCVVWHGWAKDAKEPDEATRRVFVARSGDDGKTFAAEEAATDDKSGASASSAIAARIGSDGSLGILYRRCRNGLERDSIFLHAPAGQKKFVPLVLARWQTEECPKSTGSAIDGPQGSILLAAEAEDGLEIAVFDLEKLDRRNLSYVTRDEGASEGPGAHGRQEHPSIALAEDGRVAAAWVELEPEKKVPALHWQIFDPRGRRVPGAAGKVDGAALTSRVAVVPEKDGTFTIVY